MEWSEVLDSLLEHPFDSPFLGELVRSERLRAFAMRLHIDGVDHVYHVGTAYAFKFDPRSHEDDDGRKNAYGVYIGARFIRVQSVMWVGDSRELYKDITHFNIASPAKLDAALTKWAGLPNGRMPACCPNPLPFERRDLIEVVRKYT